MLLLSFLLVHTIVGMLAFLLLVVSYEDSVLMFILTFPLQNNCTVYAVHTY